jgi:hypothetical protein
VAESASAASRVVVVAPPKPGVPASQAGASDGPGAASADADAGSTAADSGAGSVRSVERAPLGRWLAHVWPAVALGPIGKLLAGLSAGAATQPSGLSLRLLLPGLTAGTAGIAAASPPHPTAIANPPASDFRGIALPGDAAISTLILIVASAALMALLTYAVKTELGPFSYWPR